MGKRKGGRKMATQMAATPTLDGNDAKRLLDSLNIKATDRSRENAKKLAQYFKGIEKRD
ncbi:MULTISPECIES: hypothetical protein [Paenibacillus]|uniref:hypothetical protein n=1 Tax=Paenibacillus TaxID=44249 RepID=UPI0012DD791E|nr:MULTISPECIES: hypothetical protein [Paenibacillus]